MAISLPNPLPDNPLRWDGWKLYNSSNYYERLCLSFDSNASNEQIEDNCRQLLVWWQKKLPLKNQPSNPVSQLLRAGLDEASARTKCENNLKQMGIAFQAYYNSAGYFPPAFSKALQKASSSSGIGRVKRRPKQS